MDNDTGSDDKSPSTSECRHDYKRPIRKGRMHYICRKCEADISLDLVLLAEAEGVMDLDASKLSNQHATNMETAPRLADNLMERILAGDFTQGHADPPAMDFARREHSMPPCLILDADNGVDFTFEGMGLKGNRP